MVLSAGMIMKRAGRLFTKRNVVDVVEVLIEQCPKPHGNATA